MKIGKLHLAAFGPFTDRELDFGGADRSLVFVHGRNEAGKSSTLRAISDLRYGIPNQSTDNFVHKHPDMRLGGVFHGRSGASYTVQRRKGRTATLTFADGTPVPHDIEALITCGLSREEYTSMFGLDHQRLRAGGEALLNGEGEIGAALFEASAGVRSIPGVLSKLNSAARECFIPHGKSGKINVARAQYVEHNEHYKRTLIKPNTWSELATAHNEAKDRLEQLEMRQRELNATLRRITELRAVAPLLRTLDLANGTLGALSAAPLLAPNAATERAAAQAGLTAARRNAALAAAEAQELRMRLASLNLDERALRFAPAIDRLAAAVATIDVLQADRDEAQHVVSSERGTIADLCGRIAAELPPERILQCAPKSSVKTAIQQALRTLEATQQRLDQHRVSAGAAAAEDDDVSEAGTSLPSDAVRLALRTAQVEVAQNTGQLKRRNELPTILKAVQRQLSGTLHALGLAMPEDLEGIRPLLNGEIDDASKRMAANATNRDTVVKRIGEITTELRAETDRRDRLLAQGAVPTLDDVHAARSKRDALWGEMRAVYDCSAPGTTGVALADPGLVQAYEHSVKYADLLADQMTSDAQRASDLQVSLRMIANLEHDRNMLREEVAELDAKARQFEMDWAAQLGQRNLPVMPPAALREWQHMLASARASAEELQALQDEKSLNEGVVRLLVSNLNDALQQVTQETLPETLAELTAMAEALDESFARQEKAAAIAAGKHDERTKRQAEFAKREAQLVEALAAANLQLTEAARDLLLPAGSSTSATAARLEDFNDLVAAKERLDTALSKAQRAQQALDNLHQQASALAEAIGEDSPADIRMYAEQLGSRLKEARSCENARNVATQGLERAAASQREQEETAAGFEQQLAELCKAAGVESADALPEAEDASQRRREAQLLADRTRQDLAMASGRPIEALRQQLEDFDPARAEAEEEAAKQELGQLENLLRAARAAEEAARRVLQDVDDSDIAAVARQQMERSAAVIADAMTPWIRSRLAHALLDEALRRFRDRAQGPMLLAASRYFQCMTDGEFVRLLSDDSGEGRPVLLAQRANGAAIGVDGMSEGTRDQLYLALRLAALEIRQQAGCDLPVVLDDVLITSDDGRARQVLRALDEFGRGNQVILFTHHTHLVDVAEKCVPHTHLAVVGL